MSKLSIQFFKRNNSCIIRISDALTARAIELCLRTLKTCNGLHYRPSSLCDRCERCRGHKRVLIGSMTVEGALPTYSYELAQYFHYDCRLVDGAPICSVTPEEALLKILEWLIIT